MLRCTIELLPGGLEASKRTIGMVEIANVGGTEEIGAYRVILLKSAPYSVKRGAWRTALVEMERDETAELKDIIVKGVEGFDRQRLGPYDLLFRALGACVAERNPLPVRID